MSGPDGKPRSGAESALSTAAGKVSTTAAHSSAAGSTADGKTPLDYGILLVLSGIWGSAFILYKEALTVLTWPQVGLIRVLLSALFLMPLALRHFRKVPNGAWGNLAAAGLFGSGLPPFLFALAQTQLDSGITGILNTLTPVFTLLLGFLFFQLKVGPWRIAGLMVGLAGAVAIVATEAYGAPGAGLLEGPSRGGFFAVFALLGTVCYGIATNLIKARLQGVPPLTITVFSLGILAIPALIYFPFSGLIETWQHTPGAGRATGMVVLLALTGTVLASWLYFTLIQRTDVVFASVITYCIPVVALAWGFASGERLQAGHAAGLGLILVAIWLIGRRDRSPDRRANPKGPAA